MTLFLKQLREQLFITFDKRQQRLELQLQHKLLPSPLGLGLYYSIKLIRTAMIIIQQSQSSVLYLIIFYALHSSLVSSFINLLPRYPTKGRRGAGSYPSMHHIPKMFSTLITEMSIHLDSRINYGGALPLFSTPAPGDIKLFFLLRRLLFSVVYHYSTPVCVCTSSVYQSVFSVNYNDNKCNV